MRDIKAMLPEEIAAALAEMGQAEIPRQADFSVARARRDVV